MMVMEDSDAGGILATGIISRSKEHLLAGFITMHDTLKKAGINPVIHRIDNEFSKDLIEEIKTRSLKYQNAPTAVCRGMRWHLFSLGRSRGASSSSYKLVPRATRRGRQ